MPETPSEEYDDSYRTCVQTYSTLRVFSDQLTPNQITDILQVDPTYSYCKGDDYGRRAMQRKAHGWFYSTEELSSSRDTRRHLDMILTALEGKLEAVQTLWQQGCRIDITSYWVSKGQGGPWLMPWQMLKLGNLGISVWWDVYFLTDDET